MRAYFFGNMYLSSIQQGIQAAHAVADMFIKYAPSMCGDADDQYEILYQWADEHKTMILLNGGYNDTIRSLIERFESPENPYPWAPFYEGQDSLDGALTTVGIVLPEKIYEGAARLRKVPYKDKEAALRNIEDTGQIRWWVTVDGVETKVVHELSKWEFGLIQELNNYGMAS